MIDTNTTYWAADEARKTADYLMQYREAWCNYYTTSSFQTAWVRNYLAYYSPVLNPTQFQTSLQFQGVQGELVRMATPELRSAIQQVKAIVTKDRLSFTAMAQVGGSAVLDDLKLGNAIGDQVVEQQQLDNKGPLGFEASLVTGKSFFKVIWNTDLGHDIVRLENGRMVRSGGVEISHCSIFDTYYDIEYENELDRPWMMVRTTRNRWDLIAEFPDLRSYILALPSTRYRMNATFWINPYVFNDDNIDIMEFYHKPTPALPKGRMMIFGDSNTILVDSENKYECVPIVEMAPETVLFTGLGYPKMTDALPCQEMLDNSLSAIASNESAFAVQNIAIPRGSNIDINELYGMRFMSYTPVENAKDGGLPTPMNYVNSSKQTYEFSDLLSNKIQKMMFLSGVLQGNPPPGVTSGTALATLGASSLEAMSCFSLAYTSAMERVMSKVISAYKGFADLDQVIDIKAPNNQVTRKTFNKESLKNLVGLKMVREAAIMKLPGGRIEIADKLLQIPEQQWPAYMAVIRGETLEPFIKGGVTKNDQIERENDDMMNGMAAKALITDDHAKHIQGHGWPLSDPSVRMNGEQLKAFLDHIEEHYILSQQVPPDLAFMLQTGMLPQAQPGGGGAMPEQSAAPEQPQIPGSGQPGPFEAPSQSMVLPEMALDMESAQPAMPAEDLLGRMPA